MLTLPSVVNFSWGSTGNIYPAIGNEYTKLLERGIILAGAAGNPDQIGVWSPGAYVAPVEGADPSKDVEIITVGATRDGNLVNPDCTVRHQRNPNTPAIPSYFVGQERPMYDFNFSLGYDKWNTSITNSGHDRRIAKENAFMDIVAGTGWGLQCESAENGYYAPVTGTSQSSPQVVATCGLMLSVNPNLGTSGYDVQRRAYNILTFTADKFDDDGENIDHPNEPYPEFIQPSAAQDPLRRTWAPRLGYGRLNIYRAVAHSIPAKGVYEYTGSATIDDAVATSASSIAPHLIHFGAYRDGSTLVLDEGGLVLPYGRSAEDLNQGKTLINGTGTVLTIDDHVVAAFDGILTTDNTTGNNRIVTADEGKILMNGYVKDVSITGNMRLADVTIEASTSSITGRLSTGSEDAYVEAYENLIVRTCGEILVDGGRFRLMPGCHLNMLGVADIHVTSGGLLEMEFSSEVHGETGRKIVVESGSKLIVKSGAKVAIGVPVIVQIGGELVLEEDAIVDLAQFQIDQGGVLTIEPGVHLALTDKVQNICKGTFSSVGLSGQRIHITGRIETCCDILCSTIVQSATILCRGYFGATSEMGVFKMEYTDVSNVPITTSGVLKDPIIGCNFSADRSLVNFGTFLLTMDSRARITVVPKRWIPIVDATLTGCTFFDEAGDLSGTRSLQRYPINGINVIGHRNVTVVGSEFTNVRFGLFSQNCVKVKTVNQRVYRSNVGIYDVGSSVDECGSIDINVDYCTIPQGSQVGRQFNNRWQDTRWAYVPSGPSMQFLRGNEFRNFKVGVYAYNGTPVHLAPYGGMNYGRNMFAAGNVIPPATVPGSYFGAASPVDIHLLNGSLPFLECGRNQFGESTLYNLEKPEAGNISIVVSNNQWNDGISGYYVRRTTNITPVGSPLDEREDPPPDCEETAAPSGCSNTSTHFPSCFDTTYFNHGNWNDLAPTDTFIVSAYTHIRAVVKDDTADAYCRRVGMSDMILLARLSDSASSITMLDTIMVDLMSIAADTSVANEVRTSAYFAMAGVYGVTGEQDSAISSCTAALQTSTGLMDSLRAKWSILAFTAAMDTTHGDAYDSLMSVHNNTVMTDLWNILTTGDTALPRRAVYGPTDATDAKGALGDDRSGLRFTDLTPNPANSSLKVRFWVRQPSEVRIDISTVHGEKTSSVFSGEVASGWHTVLVQTGEYVPGMYVCRIKSGEQVESKLIQIAR